MNILNATDLALTLKNATRKVTVKSDNEPGAVAQACHPSTLGRLRRVGHLRSGVPDQPDPYQCGETLSLLEM